MPPFYRLCISCITVKFITWKTIQSWYATLLFLYVSVYVSLSIFSCSNCNNILLLHYLYSFWISLGLCQSCRVWWIEWRHRLLQGIATRLHLLKVTFLHFLYKEMYSKVTHLYLFPHCNIYKSCSIDCPENHIPNVSIISIYHSKRSAAPIFSLQRV